MKEDKEFQVFIPDYEDMNRINFSKLKSILSEIRERAYRRGVLHGYSFGMTHSGASEDQNIREIMEKIRLWSRDLSQTGGIPETSFENIPMYFPED